MPHLHRFCRLLISVMWLFAGAALAAPIPQAIEVPMAGGVTLRGWLYVPEGPGPHPVAIFNHGSPPKASDRPSVNPKYPVAAEQFLHWGFMVISVARRGYGETGGDWAEQYGSCNRPQFARAALTTAEDIAAVVAHVQSLSNADAKRIVLVGQSAGGWGVLGAATQEALPVKAVINFAGGRGGMRDGIANNNCSPDLLVEAAGELGARAKRPSLWLYTENDKFFAPELSQRMADAYRARGGPAQYLLLPAIGKDGHSLFSLKDGPALWAQPVKKFLQTQALLP